MNLVWLDDFLALAATGHFSQAAEARHASQPAFSRRIRALEEWIGADLFDRSTQPARLTETGEWFRVVAQDLVSRVARVPGEARRVADASSVTLRIAATHALSFTFLPRLLRNLESTVTLGPVQLVSDVLAQCEALMLQSKVHFVLSHAQPKAPGLLDTDAYLSCEVGTDALLTVSKPDAAGAPIHFLRGSERPVSVLHYAEPSGLGRILRAVLVPRLEEVPTETVFIAHLASVLRTMVLDGRGLAWLPQSLIVDDLRDGRLVEAAPREWRVPLEIRLYRERQLVGRAADKFWQAALEAPGAAGTSS
ncbi:LysR family transcriptional regulator [Caenimonas sedimenti]|uniref:LysR family transcriptional regulator n=1 Tax=Caenimonas sedimenti TaxID=2596921 RepID=A0A562ZV91_9BURK|nr:LysR family transcriptional regulator [Caenimonas sedimenti]TWO72383.1 LysR family transcriptional regulator [Caenimonas sedimenti]